MSEMTIRRANIDDASNIAKLITETALIAFRNSGPPEALARWLKANANILMITNRIMNPQAMVFIAENQQELLATGYLEERGEPDALYGYIGGVYCRRPRVGLGTRLVTQLAREADQRGYQRLEMTIGQENIPMQCLAKRLGFAPGAPHPDLAGFFLSEFAEWSVRTTFVLQDSLINNKN